MQTTYLVALLCFGADYMAPEETLAAGIKGYQQRAEAVRKKAIERAESEAKSCAASLLTAKKGKIDAKLVGSKESAGVVRNREFYFGTTTDKAKQVMALTRESELWRNTATGLKSRTLVPQLLFSFDGITPGAAGLFRWRSFRVSEVIDGDNCRVISKSSRLTTGDNGPQLEFAGRELDFFCSTMAMRSLLRERTPSFMAFINSSGLSPIVQCFVALTV